MTRAGPAIPVVAVTDRSADGGPALRVAVVADGRPVEAGPARPVIVVSDGRPTQGNEPMPIVVASGAQAAGVLAGLAIPIVVVSGSLNPVPANTVLPVISGALGTLSTTNGTWANTPTSFAYQWKRNGANIGGATANTYTIVTADIGTTLTVTVTATNAAGSTPATSAGYTPTYTQKIIAAGPIAYWPQAEAAGATVSLDASGGGFNGVYTGVTLGGAGIGDGRTSALFVPASSSRNNVNVAGLSTALNGAEGTLSLWAQVRAAGVWSDGVNRWIFRLERAAANNIVDIIKRNIAGQLDFNYKANAVAKVVSPAGQNTTAWMHYAITWSAGANQMKAYLNGAQVGSTQVGLGVWQNGTFDQADVGAISSTGSSPYDGSIAHVALFASALSGTQIVTLATVP